ncbi:MAG: hypothetical protein ACREM8_08625 [Vulcanimicrobiaceae bacterium]
MKIYLEALVRGDQTTALAQLGAPSGSPDAQLSEQQFIDPSTRIAWITSKPAPGGATVDVDLIAKKGEYFVTFHLARGPLGPIIREHNFIKP